MSRCDGLPPWRAGKTWRFNARFRDEATQDPDDLSGLKARMQFRLSADAPEYLLQLTDGAGLTVEPSGEVGLVSIVLTAPQTRLLAPNNKRTVSYAAIELYDDGVSPEEVPYSEVVEVTMLPEFAREP